MVLSYGLPVALALSLSSLVLHLLCRSHRDKFDTIDNVSFRYSLRFLQMNRIFSFLFIVVILVCDVVQSQDVSKQSPEPATAAQAASVLDLSTFPMIDVDAAPDSSASTQVIAYQSYPAKGAVIDVAKKIQSALLKKGFTELAGASITEDYASANYQGRGFTISLTVFPGSKPSTAQVNLQNLGNIDLAKLPMPSGVKLLYALPAMVSYVSEMPVDTTKSELQSLLLKQGWEKFGDTTASFYVKKNAMRLQIMVSEAPGQGGKTAIQISSEQLSVDLPVPPSFGFLQYVDSTGGMFFDTDKSQEEVIAFFKQSLGKTSWKPTTENTVRISFEDHLIFRNDNKEYIEFKFRNVEGRTQAELKYQTAKQFAEDEKKANAQIAELTKKREAEMERKKNPPKITISAPAQSTVSERDDTSIEFTTKSGAAKALLQDWMKSQEAQGWKKTVTIDSKEVGEFTLTKDGVELTAGFVDPSFIPGSITISVRGEHQLTLKK